jgi:hypothetical protein
MIKSPKTKMVRVRADALAIHPHAQRQLIPATLKKRLADLDLGALGTFHVVEYSIKGERKQWVVDGQHRLRVLLDKGYGELVLDVVVHLDVTNDAGAHDLFLKLNNRASIAPFDTFANELGKGDSVAVGVARLADKYGIQIARGTGDGKITCVAALKRLFAHDEGKALDITLGTVVTAWGTKAAALEGKLVEGIGLVFGKYNGTVDQAALVKKLSKYPGGASGVIGDAKGMMEYRRTSLARCVAERVIEAYNSGRKGTKLELL